MVRDLRNIYQAATVLEAEQALKTFGERWGTKYPTIVKQWTAKWAAHHLDVRPAGGHSQSDVHDQHDRVGEQCDSPLFSWLRGTRNQKQSPNRESALKLIYMAIHEASKKWTMPIPKWKEALNHFAILFDDRMLKTLN